jgi:hypothetical protein
MGITIQADHELIVQAVVERWENWTQARRAKEKRWQECVMNYLTEVDQSKYDAWPWRSSVCDTLSQETADTVASSILNGLFPLNEKFMELEGEDEPSMSTAAKMRDYLEGELKRASFIESVRPWAKQIAVIGNAPFIGQFTGVRRPYKVRERRRDMKSRKTTYATVQRANVKTTTFRCLDAFDVVFDPKALRVEESPLIWRLVMSKAQAMKLPRLENWNELEDVEGAAPSQPSDAIKDQRKRAYGVMKPEALHEGSDPNEIEFLLFYGDLEVDGELFENQLVIVGNRTVLMRAEVEPFWAGRPIGWGGYDQLWHTGLEKGPLEPLCGVQSLVDTFQNQKADILNLIINGAFAYVNDGIINPDNLWLRPGGFIEVGDLNNLKPLQPSANVALTYQEIAQLREQAERSSGKSRFAMGQAPGGRRTAYEANLIRGGGSSRENDILRHLANGPMEQFLTWAMGTLQQLKWDEGEIDNDVLAGKYRLNFLGADLTALRNFQIPNLQMAVQMGAQAPPEMSAPVNWRYVWEQLFRALTMDDTKALNSPEETQRVLAQIAQRERQPQQGPMGQSGSGPGGQDEELMSLMMGQEQAA